MVSFEQLIQKDEITIHILRHLSNVYDFLSCMRVNKCLHLILTNTQPASKDNNHGDTTSTSRRRHKSSYEDIHKNDVQHRETFDDVLWGYLALKDNLKSKYLYQIHLPSIEEVIENQLIHNKYYDCSDNPYDVARSSWKDVVLRCQVMKYIENEQEAEANEFVSRLVTSRNSCPVELQRRLIHDIFNEFFCGLLHLRKETLLTILTIASKYVVDRLEESLQIERLSSDSLVFLPVSIQLMLCPSCRG